VDVDLEVDVDLVVLVLLLVVVLEVDELVVVEVVVGESVAYIVSSELAYASEVVGEFVQLP
jgi:hypothetical protein